MSVILENDKLRVSIKTMGAELSGMVNKLNGLEYMWSGDPAFWGKTSPVLFPIVGALKDNTYQYNGHAYSLSRHGFAREMDFNVDHLVKDEVILSISDDEETLKKYPFTFRLSIHYKLAGSALTVAYVVENTGDDDLYFSLGAHPAFSVPLEKDTKYEDCYLVFDQQETAPRWPISADGLIETTPEPLLNASDRIALTKSLFSKDALVLKHLKSNKVSLRSNGHQHGLTFKFEGFPYLGIWAAKNADFVCIEPWCGIADSVNHDQTLATKEGIEKLKAGARWERAWKVDTF